MQALRRRRDDRAHGAEKTLRRLQSGGKVALEISQRGDEQVAEGMTLDIGSVEPVFEQLAPDGILRGQRHQALAYVSGRRNLQIRSETARRATVVCDRNDGIDPAGVSEDRLERCRQTFASPDGDDPRALAVRHQCLFERFGERRVEWSTHARRACRGG